MKRDRMLDRISNPEKLWDFVVIGGGATGIGTALDAASRGYKVALFEQSDFAKGTSSRSTKLVHGGVRYLAQGDFSLVREALHERGLLLKNAPHLAKNLSFLIPAYRLIDAPMYTIGLMLYDIMAGKLSLGRSHYIRKHKTTKYLPLIREDRLKGGIIYHDGQFDDARMAINLVETAIEHGAAAINYTKVVEVMKSQTDKVQGVVAHDLINDKKYQIKAKVVINATGVFVDSILSMDTPKHEALVRPSQGVHLTIDRSFTDSDYAIMIPKTDDGRVLFAVPWHDKIVLGTTDTVIEHPSLEPKALDKEIDFILETAGRYLKRRPTRCDVLSVFAGLRPLSAPKKGETKTKEISRSHKIIVSPSQMITITGGKWTTYRRMAEDVVDCAIKNKYVSPRPCFTDTLHIHGYKTDVDFNDPMYFYGSDEPAIKELMASSPEMAQKLHDRYPYTVAEVVWAVRNEMAMNIEDFLARRIRILFLDARAAVAMAEKVARVMAHEMQKDEGWIDHEIARFKKTAQNYILE